MSELNKTKLKKLIEEYDGFIQNWDFKFYEELPKEDKEKFKDLLNLMDIELDNFCEEHQI